MAKKFTQYLIAIALLVGGGTIFASTALASDVPQTAADLPPSIMMVWSGSDSAVSASDVANKNVVFLSNIMANGLSKKTVRRAKEHGGCRWIGAGTDVPGYWNSGRDANGVLFWFWDTRLVYECNGRKVLCGNFVRFQRPKHNVITHGRVIMVRSFAHLVVRIHLVAEARASCPDNPGTWARGSASLTQKVELRMFVKTKGRSTVRLYGNLVDRAGVKAQAKVHCETAVAIIISQPPTPPSCSCAPPPHYTNVSCTGFEEVSGAGSFLVDCAVSNDNGAEITLDAHSNDGNSRVSGINCYSQSGAPSCHGAGTFEFRVSGINDGSSIVYSSVTVVASSNGVDKPWRSDPFPVDPSGGGF
jgi:hypothetical protein